MRYLLAYVAVSIAGVIVAHSLADPEAPDLRPSAGADVATVVCESVVKRMDSGGEGRTVSEGCADTVVEAVKSVTLPDVGTVASLVQIQHNSKKRNRPSDRSSPNPDPVSPDLLAYAVPSSDDIIRIQRIRRAADARWNDHTAYHRTHTAYSYRAAFFEPPRPVYPYQPVAAHRGSYGDDPRAYRGASSDFDTATSGTQLAMATLRSLMPFGKEPSVDWPDPAVPDELGTDAVSNQESDQKNTVDEPKTDPFPVVLPVPITQPTLTLPVPPLEVLDPDLRGEPSISASRKATMAPVIKRASAYQIAINAALSKACGYGVLSPHQAFVSTIAAQIYQESNYNPNAKSGVGAQGLTQMMPATAAGLAQQYPGLRPPRPWDPFWSIEAQAHLMCDNYRMYVRPDRSDCTTGLIALSVYNGGPRAFNREEKLCNGLTPDWLASPAVRTTRPITDGSCDDSFWFDNIADMRSRSPAAFKENRDYVTRILGHQAYFIDAGWGGGWCHTPPNQH